MRENNSQNRWQQTSGNNHAHWGILTLDDLYKTSEKRSLLIAQFQSHYQVTQEFDIDQPTQTSEDFSI